MYSAIREREDFPKAGTNEWQEKHRKKKIWNNGPTKNPNAKRKLNIRMKVEMLLYLSVLISFEPIVSYWPSHHFELVLLRCFLLYLKRIFVLFLLSTILCPMLVFLYHCYAYLMQWIGAILLSFPLQNHCRYKNNISSGFLRTMDVNWIT